MVSTYVAAMNAVTCVQVVSMHMIFTPVQDDSRGRRAMLCRLKVDVRARSSGCSFSANSDTTANLRSQGRKRARLRASRVRSCSSIPFFGRPLLSRPHRIWCSHTPLVPSVLAASQTEQHHGFRSVTCFRRVSVDFCHRLTIDRTAPCKVQKKLARRESR